jgi:hypothetical protein
MHTILSLQLALENPYPVQKACLEENPCHVQKVCLGQFLSCSDDLPIGGSCPVQKACLQETYYHLQSKPWPNLEWQNLERPNLERLNVERPNLKRSNIEKDWTSKDRTSNGTEHRKTERQMGPNFERLKVKNRTSNGTEHQKTEHRKGPNIERLNIEMSNNSTVASCIFILTFSFFRSIAKRLQLSWKCQWRLSNNTLWQLIWRVINTLWPRIRGGGNPLTNMCTLKKLLIPLRYLSEGCQ